jgi:hypothetical protein
MTHSELCGVMLLCYYIDLCYEGRCFARHVRVLSEGVEFGSVDSHNGSIVVYRVDYLDLSSFM